MNNGKKTYAREEPVDCVTRLTVLVFGSMQLAFILRAQELILLALRVEIF